MVRFIRWAFAVVAIQAIVLILLSRIMPGFNVNGADAVALAPILFTVAQGASWPLIYRLSARLHPLLFPILSFGLAGFLFVIFHPTELDPGSEPIVGARALHQVMMGWLNNAANEETRER